MCRPKRDDCQISPRFRYQPLQGAGAGYGASGARGGIPASVAGSGEQPKARRPGLFPPELSLSFRRAAAGRIVSRRRRPRRQMSCLSAGKIALKVASDAWFPADFPETSAGGMMAFRLCLLLLIIVAFAVAFSEVVRRSGRHANVPSPCAEWSDPDCLAGERQSQE